MLFWHVSEIRDGRQSGGARRLTSHSSYSYKGERIAVKVMRQGLVTDSGLKAFKREVQMLNSVSNENIVAFRGFSYVAIGDES